MHNNKNLDDWLEYIEHAHTQAIDMSLERVSEVLSRLSLDYASSCIVSVAGTNGKGTTCRFIEQACLKAQLSTGVFSSPHINVFNERIRVEGKEVDDATICAAFDTVYKAAQCKSQVSQQTSDLAPSAQLSNRTVYCSQDTISLSYFEYTTLCAFVIFAAAKVDVWVIEVGLGGRLDATNIINAHIGVITSIGFDHQKFLGNTLEAIAGEKAGIIKPSQKVVIGYSDMQRSVAQILGQFATHTLVCDKDFGMHTIKASARGAVTSDSTRLEGPSFAANTLSKDTTIGWVKIDKQTYEFSLQDTNIPAQNVMTALATLSFIAKFFNAKHPFLVPTPMLPDLISSVRVPGRFETVSVSPCIILDVAHNEDSAKYLLNQLQKKTFDKCHIIIGMLKDKNIEATIDVLAPLQANWYCVDLPGPRGEKAIRLQQAVHKHNQPAFAFESVASGLEHAVVKCQSNDIIVVVGSFILAAHLMEALTHYQR